MNIDFTEGVRAVYGCVYTMPTFPFISIGLVLSGIKMSKFFRTLLKDPLGTNLETISFFLKDLCFLECK